MTTIHVQWLGDKAIVPRQELVRVVELACRTEEIDLQTSEEEGLTLGLVCLAHQGGAFNWLAEEEDLYSLDDLKVRYR